MAAAPMAGELEEALMGAGRPGAREEEAADGGRARSRGEEDGDAGHLEPPGEEVVDGGLVEPPEEEEMDGGHVEPPEEEEEMDGGMLEAGERAARAQSPPAGAAFGELQHAPAHSLAEPEHTFFGAAHGFNEFAYLGEPEELFDEHSNAEYASARTVSDWAPPGKISGEVVCQKRGATDAVHQVFPGKRQHSGPIPPPPPHGADVGTWAEAHEGFNSFQPASDRFLPQTSDTGGMSMSSAAHRMMAKMGHVEGQGLGKDNQGISSAIKETSHLGFFGLGFKSAALPEHDGRPEPLEEAETCVLPNPEWMGSSSGSVPDAETLRSWLEEGPRTEVLDGEVEHCEPEVLAAMLAAKRVLDDIPPSERRRFNDARTRANPFEGIRKEFFMNRAALKMAAMDAGFGGIFSFADAPEVWDRAVEACTGAAEGTRCCRMAPGMLYFGDVAAGPGGFSEYMLWRRGAAAKGFGFTLRGDHDFTPGKFHYRASPEVFHPYYGPADDGDLYNTDNVRALRRVVHESTRGKMLHVLMGDGGFDVTGLENIQEVMNKQLLLQQSAAALCTLRQGGHFVVKAFDLYTPFSAGLVYLLHLAFDDMCIYKPAQSRPANSERYLVCRGMRANGLALGEHLLNVNDRLNQLKRDWRCDGSGGGMDILRLVPQHVLADEPFASYLRTSNNRIGRLQAKALRRLVAYMHERGERVCDQSATRDECLVAWRLPLELPPPPVCWTAVHECALLPPEPTLTLVANPSLGTPLHRPAPLLFVVVQELHAVERCPIAIFLYEIQKEDNLDFVKLVTQRETHDLLPDDVRKGARLTQKLSDWVVTEACTRRRPQLVVGADIDGWRGLAFVWDASEHIWIQLQNVWLPRTTLLWAEITEEVKEGQIFANAVHVIDAAMIAGDDIRRCAYSERRRRAALLVDALQRHDDISRQMGVVQAPVRLKPSYSLNELSKVIAAARDRKQKRTVPQWNFEGLLFFPGNAVVQLTAEQSFGSAAGDWELKTSSKEGKQYWFNHRSGASHWDNERKSSPLSFKHCVLNLIHWHTSRSALGEDKLLESVASAIAAAGQKR